MWAILEYVFTMANTRVYLENKKCIKLRASLKNKTNCVFWSIRRHNYVEKGTKSKDLNFRVPQDVGIFIMFFESHDILYLYSLHTDYSNLDVFYFADKP